jgi:hypothetical protein
VIIKNSLVFGNFLIIITAGSRQQDGKISLIFDFHSAGHWQGIPKSLDTRKSLRTWKRISLSD